MRFKSKLCYLISAQDLVSSHGVSLPLFHDLFGEFGKGWLYFENAF